MYTSETACRARPFRPQLPVIAARPSSRNAVEREENAWLHELFVALRDDGRAAITGN
jgi:hypothetical protein